MMFVCAMSFTVVYAQEKKAVVAPSEIEKAETAKKVELFYQVVTYGETQKSPLVIISAVKLLDDLSFSGIAKPGEDGKSGAKYDRVGLLNQAKELAKGDAELLAVIAKVETPPEMTTVRGHGGHGGYGGYYGRGGHGGRHWGCDWHRTCRHGECFWACR